MSKKRKDEWALNTVFIFKGSLNHTHGHSQLQNSFSNIKWTNLGEWVAYYDVKHLLQKWFICCLKVFINLIFKVLFNAEYYFYFIRSYDDAFWYFYLWIFSCAKVSFFPPVIIYIFKTPYYYSRRSRGRCSIKKDFLKNFEKFTGKHLCQYLF